MGRTDRTRLSDLRRAVSALYRDNRQQGYAAWRSTAYDFVCPSVDTYPYQWFWDSCFHAIVLSRIDVGRAEAEIVSLLANQQPDGFVPHMTYWQRERPVDPNAPYQVAGRSRRISDSMQPPVLAEAVAAVARRGRGAAFLREVLPAVHRFYDWCDRVRDPDRDGLIAALEPHETGMDQTPAFDAYIGVSGSDPVHFEAAWRSIAVEHAQLGHDPAAIFARDRFVVEEVASNVLYAENQRVLAGSLAELDDADGAAELRARAERTEAALLGRCWAPGLADFCSLAGRDESPLPGSTVAGLMPILLRVLPEAIVERLAGRLADPADFGTRYPVPSVSRGHPAYRAAPRGTVLWRGQSWINMNWYLARGLRRHGREQLASSIEDASLALVERSGFREHYNPETGVGYGARGFAWSALVLEMLSERVEPDGSAG